MTLPLWSLEFSFVFKITGSESLSFFFFINNTEIDLLSIVDPIYFFTGTRWNGDVDCNRSVSRPLVSCNVAPS